MGQATVDLPESAQNAPAANSSADDLLAQLAGQEIDRLLADADEKGTAPTSPEPVTEEAEAIDTAAPEQVEAILAPAKLAADAEAAAVPEPIAAKEDYAAHVGELFKQLNVPSPAAPVPQPEPTPAPPAAVEEQTSTAERAELTPAAAAPEPVATVEQVLEQATITTDRTPFYVRALELLNSPFDFCPDELRDTLGKVAILTMMNSLGVLLYVMLFKKH